jgi:hypothetical protein
MVTSLSDAGLLATEQYVRVVRRSSPKRGDRPHSRLVSSHWPAYARSMRSQFAVLLTLSVLCACGSSPDAEQGPLDDPTVRAKLHDVALRASIASGDPSPTTMIAVASPDHQVAEQLVSGDIVNDHAPVYVVEMSGGPFIAAEAPNGGAPFQGDFLTITVDAQTLVGTDAGITTVAPDLTLISPDVVNLLAD